MAEPRERICTNCNERYVTSPHQTINLESECPECGSRCWEYFDIRIRGPNA